MSSQTPRLGDIVLLQQGIGVIRYYGNVDWDEETSYFGVELKGPSISGGHNGTYNGKKYFTVSGGDGRGIFVKTSNILRVISSEEILEKLAEVYDILKGRKGHSHFIDRARYDDLYTEHEKLQDAYQDKLTEVEDLNTDLAILKEQISMMKGTLHDKIDETAKIHDKVAKAERKLGTRISQFDLESVKKQLEKDANDIENNQSMNIPDYSKTTKKKGHTKQRSTTEIELDQLHDDFSDIAKTVQAYGQKNMDITGPTHYRRFSNTTKQILDEHKRSGQQIGQYTKTAPQKNGKKGKGHRARGSMKIGDITDGQGIDYDTDEEQQKLERESENEDDDNTQQKRKPKTRQSRQSRQLDDEHDQINNTYFNDEQEIKERESNEEDDDDTQPKRTVKSRASRESRQLDDVEVTYGDDDAPPKRTQKSRASRESRQLDGDDIDNYGSEDEDEEEYEEDDHIMEIQDDPLGNNMQIDANIRGKQIKRNKARGSFQVAQPVLSASMLETHNEHHLEEAAGQINGPKDSYHPPTHKKSDTMTSDSSAYRAFMSVD
eukprot:62696_1